MFASGWDFGSNSFHPSEWAFWKAARNSSGVFFRRWRLFGLAQTAELVPGMVVVVHRELPGEEEDFGDTGLGGDEVGAVLQGFSEFPLELFEVFGASGEDHAPMILVVGAVSVEVVELQVHTMI